MKKRALCTVLACLVSAWLGAASQAAQEADREVGSDRPDDGALHLVFGTYSTDRPSDMVRKFRPILDALEASLEPRLGHPVRIRMQVTNDYRAGIEDLTIGRVDFARFGATSYITAKQEVDGIRLLAIESNKGRKEFTGIICVVGAGPIRRLEDLKGKRFAFGNELSTIGRFLSQDLLLEHGIRASDLGAYEYLGRHDKVGAAVAGGLFDAGALKESTFRQLVEQGKDLRALAEIPVVTKPWVARAELSAEIEEALRQALFALDDPEILATLKREGFLPAEDADYEPVRRAMARNADFFD